MATNVSSQLLWEVLKGHNCFVRKNLHGNIFSAERGNLYAKHSYKYSGVANAKAVDIREGADGGVDVTVKRPKQAGKPAAAVHKATSKQAARRAVASARKLAAGYRPDLASAAAARASAVHRALRKKAALKK